MNVWSEPQHGHITYIGIYHEMISTVILPGPMIQEGQLSVIGETGNTSTR